MVVDHFVGHPVYMDLHVGCMGAKLEPPSVPGGVWPPKCNLANFEPGSGGVYCTMVAVLPPVFNPAGLANCGAISQTSRRDLFQEKTGLLT